MDLRTDHQLTERTRENDGDVYILGTIVQVFFDNGDTAETFTCLREADAQQKFDALTQGWYRNPSNENSDQFQQDDVPQHSAPIKLRPGWKAILYEDGTMVHWKAKKLHHEDVQNMFGITAAKEAEFFCDTDIVYLRSFVDKGLCYAQNWFQYFNKLRLTDEVSIDDWGSTDSERVDEFHGTVREFNEYCAKLRKRNKNPGEYDDEESEWNRQQDEYTEIGHDTDGILWWWKGKQLHTAEGGDSATHDELVGDDVPRGRYDPNTHTVSFITVGGRGTPQFILDALEEKFGGDLNVKAFNPPSPLERKSPRELKYGFNAFITPEGEWIQVPADGTTHYEFAVSALGFQDLNDALYNGYIRVSFSPRGSTFVQVQDMPESLPIISEAFQDIYRKHGGIQVVAEDEENTYIVPLGTLVMANSVSDLKDWDKNPVR